MKKVIITIVAVVAIATVAFKITACLKIKIASVRSDQSTLRSHKMDEGIS